MHESDGIHPGMAVLTADGQRIGQVLEVSEPPPAGSDRAGYVRISTEAREGDRQMYLPFTAVREVRPEGLYLDRAEVAAGPWGEAALSSMGEAGNLRPGATDAAPPGWSPAPQDQTLELRGEELQAHTELVQTGELGIRKEIITEERTLEVPIRREEVVIERHPVEPKPAREEMSEGEVLRVPVWGEQVQVEKQPVVIEELHITKRVVEETEHVAATVRREEARLEPAGDVPVSGDAAP
jgi:uncharacterized protein (TIGR02271 family)